MKHLAIFIDNTIDKELLLERLEQAGFLRRLELDASRRIVVYSSIAIDKLLEEELKHDRILIRGQDGLSLRYMSSGQQRKALLTYLFEQQPELMILDDLYSHVDTASQSAILQSVNAMSASLCFVQIFSRKRDLLPFIQRIVTLDATLSVVEHYSHDTFRYLDSMLPVKESFLALPTSYDTHNSSHNFKFDALVDMQSVSVKYDGRPILTNLNWVIRPAEFWQLVGPNGSGKSTLVTMITGDNPKAYGQNIKLFGYQKGTGESIWDIKQHIGYFTPAMMPGFERNDRVEDMIMSGFTDSIGLYVEPTAIQVQIAAQWMALLGSSFENKLFKHLSLAQQRMVMVARALLKHPPLLILDEPTIELDEENGQLFVAMVNSIAAEKKVAIIYVSHREEENLQPTHIFELIPTPYGYTGVIRK